MSRLGKTAIPLPEKVEVKSDDKGSVQVKGPKGTLNVQFPFGLSLKVEGNEVAVERNDEKCNKASHGLYRSLLKNCIIGVSSGYEVQLNLIGVGFRANVQGKKINLQVGYSHPTDLEIPSSLEVTVDKGTTIIVKGINKQEVGQFAANIRAIRPPEPYKGKGIRYVGEYVRKKEGKAAKGKA